jgi:cytochrome c-type biogenesis protein CcmH
MTKRRWLRALIAAGLLAAAGWTVAAQKAERAKQIGKRMMCQCGCNQILSECNHLGCYSSSEMLKKVDEQIAASKSDQQILDAFVAEYGLKALAEPPRAGWGRVAWVMPWAAGLGGLGIVWLTLRSMRRSVAGRPAPVAAATGGDALEQYRQRADRESEE